MGRVVDAYAKGQRRGAGLRVELRRTACVFAVGALASGVRVSCFSRALQKALRRLRADVFDAALRRKAAFFVLGEQSGDDRLDADAVATAVERDASVALALFALCPGLAGELLTCVPVLAVLVRGASSPSRSAAPARNTRAKAPSAAATWPERRAHSVKLAGGDAVEAARFAELADAALHAGVAHGVARGALQGVLGVVGKLAVLGVVFRGGHRVERGDLSGGDLLAFALYAGYASLGLAGLAKFAASELKAGKRAAKACLRVLALADVDAASAALLDGAADAGGAGVTPDHLVLDDVTFGCSADRAAGRGGQVRPASVLAGGAVVETGTVAVLAQDPKSSSPPPSPPTPSPDARFEANRCATRDEGLARLRADGFATVPGVDCARLASTLDSRRRRQKAVEVSRAGSTDLVHSRHRDDADLGERIGASGPLATWPGPAARRAA
ncbi:ATPase [Aureococcus anophagefferens]|nr:ATPase [Aureococcus anophagefferens]